MKRLFAVVVLFALTGCSGMSSYTSPETVSESDSQSYSTPVPDAPSVSDYSLEQKVKSKECFGSAGCNLVIGVDVVLLNSDMKGVPVDITYKATGGDDGAQIQTISIDEDGKYYADDLIISVHRSSSKVKLKITDVESE